MEHFRDIIIEIKLVYVFICSCFEKMIDFSKRKDIRTDIHENGLLKMKINFINFNKKFM